MFGIIVMIYEFIVIVIPWVYTITLVKTGERKNQGEDKDKARIRKKGRSNFNNGS